MNKEEAERLVRAYGEAMRERGERSEGLYTEAQWLEKVAESEVAKADLLAALMAPGSGGLRNPATGNRLDP